MAKKTVKKLNGAKLLAPNGSLVFCENCEKVVGSINKSGYRYINFIFICTCGMCGRVEIIRDGHKNGISQHLNRMPKVVNGVCCCRECDNPLLSVKEESVYNFSFFTECICGEKYDTKPSFNKRLGETLRILKKAKDTR